MIRFGPSGNSKSFYDQRYSSSVQMPAWLKNMGLNAYEYQCSKGVNIGKSKAIEIGEQAKEHDIYMSIHAPYYINLISEDPEKKRNPYSIYFSQWKLPYGCMPRGLLCMLVHVPVLTGKRH